MSIRAKFADYAQELYPEEGTENWNERQRERQEDFLDGIELMHKLSKKKIQDRMAPIEVMAKKIEIAPKYLVGYTTYQELLGDLENIEPEDHE